MLDKWNCKKKFQETDVKSGKIGVPRPLVKMGPRVLVNMMGLHVNAIMVSRETTVRKRSVN